MLRQDWDARRKRLSAQAVLRGVESTDFLQAVALLATRKRRLDDLKAGKPPEHATGISCKRKDVLRLSLTEYKEWAELVTETFLRVGRLLHGEKVFSDQDVPYRTQLTPLAAVTAVLGGQADIASVRAKLARWYWCGVFGELYGGAIESRFAKDLPELLAWVNGGEEPDTVKEASFAASRLLTLRTRNSAAYKGVYALLIRDGGLDFCTGVSINEAMYFDERIDIHHIFPQAWCKTNGIKPAYFDSIVNKTPLSAKTNRMVGGVAPSVYLLRIAKSAEIDDTEMDRVLHSHVIDPLNLRNDDFEGFFSTRSEGLLARIEAATGKHVNRDILVDEADEASDELVEMDVAPVVSAGLAFQLR